MTEDERRMTKDKCATWKSLSVRNYQPLPALSMSEYPKLDSGNLNCYNPMWACALHLFHLR